MHAKADPYGSAFLLFVGTHMPSTPAAVSEPFPVDPQSQRGIGNEVDFLAVGQGVVAVRKRMRIVALCHLVVIGGMVADAFNSLLRNIFHRVGDGKPFVGRAVYQVRGSASYDNSKNIFKFK